MCSAVEVVNQYFTESSLNWKGLKSSKFGPTRFHIPSRDIISSGFNIPHQGFHNHSQRKHLSSQNSPEKQFRSSIRKLPQMVHWRPRPSCKLVMEFTPTKPHPRPEKLHLKHYNQMTQRSAGIRTFYNQRIKAENSFEYSVEDRMQRKSRANISDLRKTFIVTNPLNI